MHHEDRAGVNALIRGIDRIGTSRWPVLIVMCTNRVESLDPAIMRRAADVFEFTRPNLEQRMSILESFLTGLGFSRDQLNNLAELTGENKGRSHGCTYSDIVQRLLPDMLLKAFPESSVEFDQVRAIAEVFVPTIPFQRDGK